MSAGLPHFCSLQWHQTFYAVGLLQLWLAGVWFSRWIITDRVHPLGLDPSAGTNIQTGEEVAIKLVGWLVQLKRQPNAHGGA
jgi:hypothetical protein